MLDGDVFARDDAVDDDNLAISSDTFVLFLELFGDIVFEPPAGLEVDLTGVGILLAFEAVLALGVSTVLAIVVVKKKSTDRLIWRVVPLNKSKDRQTRMNIQGNSGATQTADPGKNSSRGMLDFHSNRMVWKNNNTGYFLL